MEPLLADIVGDTTGLVLDIGCGEGWALSRFPGATMIGVDGSAELLAMAETGSRRVQARLPDLSWLKNDVLSGAFAVLVLEHLADLETLFAEVHRTVRTDGWLAVGLNHPAYTAPSAGPIVDPTDGEVLWRWGPYFEPALTNELVAGNAVTFHHRPIGHLLQSAATHGWKLERFEERPLSPRTVSQNPTLRGQEGIPRLLGVRWLKY